MKPLQLWLPIFGSSLTDPAVERDSRRAFESWRGELTTWLLPDLPEVVHWREGRRYRLAGVPSETLDRADVYHVGHNNHVIGLSAERFPDQSVNGLLEVWLNTPPLGLVAAPTELSLSIPRLIEGKMQYEDRKLALRPGPMIPITQFDEHKAHFSASWPPALAAYRTISPEAESLDEYGRLYRTEESKGSLARSMTTDEAALPTALEWPEPLNRLIPGNASFDVMFAQHQMRIISQLSGDHPSEALAQARGHARKFVFDCQIERQWAWFWPSLDHGGSEEVLLEAEGLGIFDKDWRSLRKNPEFTRRLKDLVPARRVWGAIGLFWALLLDHLERNETFHSCQKCGHLFKGPRNKRYCSREDNRQCFSERGRSYQRRSRSQRRDLNPRTRPVP